MELRRGVCRHISLSATFPPDTPDGLAVSASPPRVPLNRTALFTFLISCCLLCVFSLVYFFPLALTVKLSWKLTDLIWAVNCICISCAAGNIFEVPAPQLTFSADTLLDFFCFGLLLLSFVNHVYKSLAVPCKWLSNQVVFVKHCANDNIYVLQDAPWNGGWFLAKSFFRWKKSIFGGSWLWPWQGHI